MTARIRVISIAVVVIIMLAALVGCTNNTTGTPTANPTANPTVGSGETSEISEPSTEQLELMNVTIYTGGSDPGSFPEDECHKFIKDKLGIDFTILYAADPDSQIQLMLAGGDYPELMYQKTGNAMNDYIMGGHILDLTDYYYKHAPNLVAMMEDNPRIFKLNIEGFSEEIWYVPAQICPLDFPNIAPSMGIRYDIWRGLAENPADLPRPKDTEEFYEMLKAMVDSAPEYEGQKTYAISGWIAEGWGSQWMIRALCQFNGSGAWMGHEDPSNNWQQEYCIDSEMFDYAMRWYNRAFREGYADPEAVTMNREAHDKKFAQGLIYSSPYSGSWLDGVFNTARAAAGHPEQKLVPYTWMTFPRDQGFTNEQIVGGSDPSGFTKLWFTKNNKNADELFRRMSWFSTEEGRVFMGMGVEGIHWNYDTDGIRKPNDDILALYQSDADFVHKTGIGKYGWFASFYNGLDANNDAWNMYDNKYVVAGREDEYDVAYKEILGLNMALTVEASAAAAGAKSDKVFWESALDLGVAGTPMEDIERQLGTLQNDFTGRLYMAKDDAEFDKIMAEWRAKAENIGYMDYYNHINPIILETYGNYKAALD